MNDISYNNPEIIRITYRYRRLLLTGRLNIPASDAAKLLGPDSCYRLYSEGTIKRKNKSG